MKIDLGEIIQGVMLMVLGFILLVVWLLVSVLSLVLPFGSPQSLLYIGGILILGGIALTITGFRYKRRSR